MHCIQLKITNALPYEIVDYIENLDTGAIELYLTFIYQWDKMVKANKPCDIHPDTRSNVQLSISSPSGKNSSNNSSQDQDDDDESQAEILDDIHQCDINNPTNLATEKLIEEIHSVNESIEILTEIITESKTDSNLQLRLLTNEITSQNTALYKKLEPFIKFYSGTNMEKGNMGEEVILKLLTSDLYSSGVVKDTSGKSNMGDMHFTWQNINCLIEVKNKKTIIQEDVAKFARNITYCCEKNIINCGMFVSLTSARIPGKTGEIIQYELINEVPCIYITLTDVQHLHYGVAFLNNIVGIYKTANLNGVTHKLQQYFKKYHTTLLLEYSKLDKLIGNKQLELKALQKEFNNVTTALTECKDDLHLLTMDTSNTNKDVSKEVKDVSKDVNAIVSTGAITHDKAEACIVYIWNADGKRYMKKWKYAKCGYDAAMKKAEEFQARTSQP